jgi:hypothetical protein
MNKFTSKEVIKRDLFSSPIPQDAIAYFKTPVS